MDRLDFLPDDVITTGIGTRVVAPGVDDLTGFTRAIDLWALGFERHRRHVKGRRGRRCTRHPVVGARRRREASAGLTKGFGDARLLTLERGAQLILSHEQMVQLGQGQ